ncbi:hypothetical protein GJ609_10875 [Escherichia coli]|nr:hypothetical protein [Escherichia coli]
MLPSETMIWQPEFTDKTLSRKPGAVHPAGRCFSAFTIGETRCQLHLTLKQNPYRCLSQLRPGKR